MEIKKKKIISVVVDAQNDFMSETGALYVPKSKDIIPNLERIVTHFNKIGVTQIFTMDAHFNDSKEISSNPNFRTTFPPHCLFFTNGMELIPEIKNIIKNEYGMCSWVERYADEYLEDICSKKSICISKDDFDLFKGNDYAHDILDIIKPDIAYVSGVASNVCVDYVVRGLIKRGIQVRVITDAIKEIDTIPMDEIFNNWIANGVKLIKSVGIRS